MLDEYGEDAYRFLARSLRIDQAAADPQPVSQFLIWPSTDRLMAAQTFLSGK